MADGCLAIAAQTDTDLRHFPPIAAYAPQLEQLVIASEAANVKNTTITTTTTTTSPKVSFKIQKLYNKLDKSTAQQPATTVALDSDDEMSTAAATTTNATAVGATNIMMERKDGNAATTYLKNETSTKHKIVKDDNHDQGVGSGGGGVVSASGSLNAKRHNSLDITEQLQSKHKAESLSTDTMEIDKADSDEKKRISTSSTDLEEPLAKKIKQAKFDA